MPGLWDSAETTYFIGVRVYAYGLYILYGLALACLVMFLHARRKWPKGSVALTGSLMLPIGFLLSRLLFLLLDAQARQWPFFGAFFTLTAGGFSMFGALIGAFLGVLLSCRLLRFNCRQRLRVLDVFAAGALLFIAMARMGEGLIEDFGISFPLSSEVHGMMIINDAYGDYLAVYKLESLYALILFVLCELLMRQKHPEGDVFFIIMLLFGAGQILFESFREDGHMAFAFVKVQHLMAAGCLAGSVLYFALKGLKTKNERTLSVLSLISLPLMVVILVALEFALDRTELSKVLLYLLYFIVIVCPCVMCLILRNKLEIAAREGKNDATGQD